jgi:hypothetical protein
MLNWMSIFKTRISGMDRVSGMEKRRSPDFRQSSIVANVELFYAFIPAKQGSEHFAALADAAQQ